jgi:hypothetical protein
MRPLLVVSVALLAGCGPVDLPVVDVHSDGGFQQPDTSCMRNEDCLGGQYCSRPPGCGTAIGVCRQKPLSCSGEHDPECGCDGVTYFNACLRRFAGVSMRNRGLCESGRACDTTSPCESGQFCARIAFVPNECNLNVAGACWVLPSVTCTEGTPPAPPAPTFVPCGGGACLNVCDALRRQTPVLIRQQMSGPCP